MSLPTFLFRSRVGQCLSQIFGISWAISNCAFVEFLTVFFFRLLDEIISDGSLSTVQSNPGAAEGGVVSVKVEFVTLLWPAAVV